MASILVVDDESSMRDMLEILLRKQGHEVHLAADAPAAVARAAQGELDLVVTDLRLGSGSGMDVLAAVKTHSPATEVVIITAFATAENAIQAMKLGAYDYVLKPFKLDELKLVVAKALERRALVAENRALRHRAGAAGEEPELLGRSPGMEEVRSLVEKVARSRSTILVMGESGTGKEVVARAIHRGAGPDRPFVAINCGAIPEGLLESELFGHEKGSFTGAVGAKAGLFEVAGTGTLFLDEVGELPPHLQVKLLRVLQERRVRRVGGQSDLAVGARIVAATNRDLGDEVRLGRFREDLYYRLNVIQIRVPPLRERKEDVPLFLEHFLERFAAEAGRPVPRLAPEAEGALLAHEWPGNVRELANVVERAVTLSGGTEIVEPAVLPPALRGRAAALPEAQLQLPDVGMDLQAHLDAIERNLLEQALARAGGVKTEAARLLSLTFRSLRYRLAKFGIGRD
ncbi:sigma-54 dependent transcriptional regulator [Anaeromyxobacter sp. Fw109-5]|uniref:sigma-54-dependent transcriptional regulator n=1 Tax=Anaeromyxobacter sp. (strain Fw109-5) TaxID=404589 RepID=UPI0000ED7921|nr:sigma-54 dependent transcriptional regulator [Anaeromyxobacter sp. Fw109-5]ABS24884.1 two component, sigma54 specific, transcriptional regulator, Fis family [Anaeromyxobacter sp. Fw109-5]